MGKMNEWLRRGVNNDNNGQQDDSIFSRPQMFEDGAQGKAHPQQGFYAPQYNNVIIYQPKNEGDIQVIIDFLKKREPAIVNLAGVDIQRSQRMLDFLSGAVYALGGRVHNISGKIYFLTPEGINITLPENY